MSRIREIPLPGQRILRSLIAVLLCFAVYALRGRQGMVKELKQRFEPVDLRGWRNIFRTG